MIKKDKGSRLVLILRYLFSTLVTFALLSTSASNEEVKVPVELQAKLLLTALTYDKNLKRRTDEKLKIGILYFPEIVQSKEEASNFSKVLERFRDKKVSGLSIDKVLLAYRGNSELKKMISFEKINVLYLALGKMDLIKNVTNLTQSEKILSFTSIVEYVSKCGISMAVGIKSNKPKIYLNLFSARTEGADFSAKLLRVVEIID